MKHQPQCRLEIALQQAMREGDLVRVQIALSALREVQPKQSGRRQVRAA